MSRNQLFVVNHDIRTQHNAIQYTINILLTSIIQCLPHNSLHLSLFLAFSFVGNLTPFAKQAIKEMSSHGYRMEYFRDAELLVDITEHKLVPGQA